MTEPLGVLLLPSKLERFELADHARDLLAIPRVIALEASRGRVRGTLADALAARAARRLRFPGEPRVLVLYHPMQYPLARALVARYEQTELWYVRSEATASIDTGRWSEDELQEYDRLAAERAAGEVTARLDGDPRAENLALRERLIELEVISSRPFVPGARIERG